MSDTPCQEKEKEWLEALMSWSEANHRLRSFFPATHKPLEHVADVEPFVLTSEGYQQWLKLGEVERQAREVFDAKSDALVKCREARAGK